MLACVSFPRQNCIELRRWENKEPIERITAASYPVRPSKGGVGRRWDRRTQLFHQKRAPIEARNIIHTYQSGWGIKKKKKESKKNCIGVCCRRYIKMLPYGAFPEAILHYSKIILKTDFPYDFQISGSWTICKIGGSIGHQVKHPFTQVFMEDDSDKKVQGNILKHPLHFLSETCLVPPLPLPTDTPFPSTRMEQGEMCGLPFDILG